MTLEELLADIDVMSIPKLERIRDTLLGMLGQVEREIEDRQHYLDLLERSKKRVLEQLSARWN